MALGAVISFRSFFLQVAVAKSSVRMNQELDILLQALSQCCAPCLISGEQSNRANDKAGQADLGSFIGSTRSK